MRPAKEFVAAFTCTGFRLWNNNYPFKLLAASSQNAHNICISMEDQTQTEGTDYISSRFLFNNVEKYQKCPMTKTLRDHHLEEEMVSDLKISRKL